MRKVIPAITVRTDAEWPPDHPLRKGAKVLSNREIADLKEPPLWICSVAGEKRIDNKDDPDTEGVCASCGVTVVHRASAPPVIKICLRCFATLQGANP